MTQQSNGAILYRGHSELDGAPIVVIATGLSKASNNAKTGDMIQTWIMREDIAPHEAIKTGADSSICGDCPLRGTGGKERGCYVVVHQAPLVVWKAYHRGNYPELSLSEIKAAGANRAIRLGSYGDPAAVPVAVWKVLTADAKVWTGYTHQWRENDNLQGLCMASADSEQDRDDAVARGWRTFRVKTDDMPMMPNERVCPATTVGLDCATCGACKGNASGNTGTIVINVHGSKGVISNASKALRAA